MDMVKLLLDFRRQNDRKIVGGCGQGRTPAPELCVPPF